MYADRSSGVLHAWTSKSVYSPFTNEIHSKMSSVHRSFHMFCHCDVSEIIGAQSLTNNCCFVRFLQPVYPSTCVVNSASTKYKDKFEIDLHVLYMPSEMSFATRECEPTNKNAH